MKKLLIISLSLALLVGCTKEPYEPPLELNEIVPLPAKKVLKRLFAQDMLALSAGPAPDLKIVTGMEYGTGAPGALFGTLGDPLQKRLDISYRNVSGAGYLHKVLKIDSGMHWIMETNCPVDNVTPLPFGANPRDWGWFMIKRVGTGAGEANYYDPSNRRFYWDSVLEVKHVWEGAYRYTLHKDSYQFSINCHPSVPNCDQWSYEADTMALYWGGMDRYSLYTNLDPYISMTDTTFIVLQVIINWGTAWDETDYSNNHAFIPVIILPGGTAAYIDDAAWDRAVNPSAPENIVQQWTNGGKNLTLTWDGGGILWEVYIDGVLAQRSASQTYSAQVPRKAKNVTLVSIGEFSNSDPVTVPLTRN